MQYILSIVQIVISILLIILILLQQRGGGLGNVFGGSGDVYRTKRGVEKFIFRATIVLVAIFLALGIVRLFIN